MNEQRENPALRDQLALERTKLANERTLLAYLRTAIVLAAAGATIIKLVPMSLSILVLGGILLAVGVGTGVVGGWHFARVARHIAEQSRLIDPPAGPRPEG